MANLPLHSSRLAHLIYVPPRKSCYSPECVEGVSLLKKSALSWLRPLIGLETPQKRRIWCPIWGESVHRGSFSTGWGVLGSKAILAAFATMGATAQGGA